MIKAIFLDFDWTLYSHDTHCIPQSAVRALRKAHDRGIKIGLATGRSMSETRLVPQYKEIPFDFFVTMNGGICLDSNEKVVAGVPFCDDTLNVLVKLFSKKEIPMVFATEDSTYINLKNQRVIDAHKNITYIDHTLSEYQADKKVYLAVFFVDGNEEQKVLSMIPNVDAKRWGLLGIDIVPKGTDKARGIGLCLEKCGIKPSECMVFGDSFNDLGMFEFAGTSVAMGNAEQCLKNVATYVTDTVDNSGVAEALKFFGIL